MTVKELAKNFEISINQLIMISGYSKQGLYDVLNDKVNRNDRRFNAFLEHLHFISKSMYEQDLAEARIQLNTRNKCLEQLKENK